jgi:hypothetical protein
VISVLVFLLMATDLPTIKAQPDLEKRSEMALANADADVTAAREAYNQGELAKMQTILQDLRDSVNVSLQSLEDTHKRARNSKYYKQAELKTRALARRLMTLADEVSVDDRKTVEDARQRVLDVHDQLLGDIMGKKK